MTLDDANTIQSVQRMAMMPPLAFRFNRKLGLMAETLIIHTNHAGVLEIAEQAFGRFPRPIPEETTPLQIDLWIDDSSPAQPQLNGLPAPRYFLHNGWFCVQFGSLGFAISDLRAGRAFGVISECLLGDQSFTRYHILEALGLAMLGLARQYFVLHAACLERNGTGVILLADSGAGKSSLAYAGLRHGYSLITEDSLQVKALAGGQYALYGMPWKLHLLPDAGRLFPELATPMEQVELNGERKLEIDVETFFPGATRITTRPSMLVFLERDRQLKTAGTCITALPRQAAQECLRAIWTWEIGWDERLECAVQNMLNLPAYRLEMNGSPEDAMAALDGILCEQPSR